MKILYIMCYEVDNGESDIFFNEKKEPITINDLNDANWRGEYFDSIMRLYGIDVKYLKYDKKLADKAYKKIRGV